MREKNGRKPSLAIVAFAIVECIALAVWLVVGRFQWFYNDDWDFLAARKIGNLGDLFRPHNEHWVTVPVIAYRLLYSIFGLRAYFPYRLMIVLTHLVAAALLLFLMRRSGVKPWIATAAASFFAFFGQGSPDIIVPVQVCFTGALVLGLVQLILADHDGPIERRDWFALLTGLIGLMFSAFAVSMVVVVGIAVLARRGWRLALFHTVPLGAIYAIWYAAIGHEGFVAGYSPRKVPGFIIDGWHAVALAIGRILPMVIVIAIVLVAGFAIAWRERRGTRRINQLTAPLALVAGSAIFMASASTARSNFGAEYATQSRYVYLAAAMTLPLFAIAVDALVRRWRLLLPAALALFVVGVPANIQAARHAQTVLKPRHTENRLVMLSIAHSPVAREVPRSIHPEPGRAQAVTVGWLVDGADHSRIPRPGKLTHDALIETSFRLAFAQERGAAPTTGCTTLRNRTLVRLGKGQVIGLYGNLIQIAPRFVYPSGVNIPLLFFPEDGARIAVQHATGAIYISPVTVPWNFRVSRINPRIPPRICIER